MKKDEMKAQTVASMARSGSSAREISESLGISRQRVYQIAKTSGVKLPLTPPGRRLKTSPKARIQTGGVTAEINHSVSGSISELLVAADLMARGWRVFMPVIASKGHDLIAVKGARIATVEVRSAYRNGSDRLIFSKKPDCASEIYALVITGEPVCYEPDID